MNNQHIELPQNDIIACDTCRLVFQNTHQSAFCPRCHSHLHHSVERSLSYSAAFLLTAMVFYIPAILLPVMHTDILGNSSTNTIMTGIIEFWKSGSYIIALLIFTASIVIPCIKFLALLLLITTAYKRSQWARYERTKIYYFIEYIGYWSMLDVIVVAVIASLVQFQALSHIEPRSGIFFFGIMVIFTMLSTLSYDPHLIWNRYKNGNE